MPYTIDPEPRFLRIRWTGAVTRDDLEGLLSDIPEKAQAYPVPPDTLHDLSSVTGVEVSFPDLVSHSRHRFWTPIPVPVRSASVCPDPLTLGVALVLGKLNANPGLEMEAFHSEAEALSWLAEPRVNPEGSPQDRYLA